MVHSIAKKIDSFFSAAAIRSSVDLVPVQDAKVIVLPNTERTKPSLIAGSIHSTPLLPATSSPYKFTTEDPTGGKLYDPTLIPKKGDTTTEVVYFPVRSSQGELKWIPKRIDASFYLGKDGEIGVEIWIGGRRYMATRYIVENSQGTPVNEWYGFPQLEGLFDLKGNYNPNFNYPTHRVRLPKIFEPIPPSIDRREKMPLIPTKSAEIVPALPSPGYAEEFIDVRLPILDRPAVIIPVEIPGYGGGLAELLPSPIVMSKRSWGVSAETFHRAAPVWTTAMAGLALFYAGLKTVGGRAFGILLTPSQIDAALAPKHSEGI